MSIFSLVHTDLLRKGNKLNKIEYIQGEGNNCKERKSGWCRFLSLICQIKILGFWIKNVRDQFFASEQQQGLKFVLLCFHLSFLSLGCGCCSYFCCIVCLWLLLV